MTEKFYAYVHYKPSGDPFYVGKGYRNRCLSRCNRNKAWHEIIFEFGWNNISIEVIPRSSEIDALNYEKELIAEYRAQGYKLVNIKSGGKRGVGYRHTPEAKQKIAAAHKGRPRPKHTAEAKRKISLARKGKPLSEAHKIVLSIAGKKRLIKYYPPKTPEAKERIIASRRGYKMTPQELAEHSERMRKRRPISDEGRNNLRISQTGRKDSPDRIAQRAASIRATNERKRAAGISLSHTPEHNAKIAAALKGNKRPPEFGRKISEVKKANNARRRAEKLNRESQSALPA